MKKFALLTCALFALTACGSGESASTAASTASQASASSSAANTTINWDNASVEAREKQVTFAKVEKDVADGAYFYDVRSAEEFASGNFGITKNFPLPDMREGKLPDVPKDALIYVHCQQGNWSAEATKLLREAGYTNVVDLGGLKSVEAIGGKLQ